MDASRGEQPSGRPGRDGAASDSHDATANVAGSALIIRGLTLTRGTRAILQGVDLQVEPGQICALMGASGAGKSTVLRCVAALQAFDAGTVQVGDVTLRPGAVPRESQLRGLRQQVGMVFQAHALFEHLTALENVMLAPLHALGWPRDRARDVGIALLTELSLEHRANAYPRELSGGEAQRVAIARALAPNPRVLLMDEPTSALDSARRAALGASLRTLASTGRGLLVSTHDEAFVREYADRVAVIVDGVIVRAGEAK